MNITPKLHQAADPYHTSERARVRSHGDGRREWDAFNKREEKPKWNAKKTNTNVDGKYRHPNVIVWVFVVHIGKFARSKAF